MRIITEAIDHESLDLVEEYADMIQIGARNMQNYSLLRRAGRSRKPVLLKRGMSATLEEFLMAAEYILSARVTTTSRCARAGGVRTFADHTCNTFGPQRRAGGAAAEPFADPGRSEPRDRQAE